MVVNLRRGAPVSAGTTLPSAGGLLRDPSCSQLDPSRTLPMESCCPGVKSCVQSVGAAPKKKKKKKKKKKSQCWNVCMCGRTKIAVYDQYVTF